MEAVVRMELHSVRDRWVDLLHTQITNHRTRWQNKKWNTHLDFELWPELFKMFYFEGKRYARQKWSQILFLIFSWCIVTFVMGLQVPLEPWYIDIVWLKSRFRHSSLDTGNFVFSAKKGILEKKVHENHSRNESFLLLFKTPFKLSFVPMLIIASERALVLDMDEDIPLFRMKSVHLKDI